VVATLPKGSPDHALMETVNEWIARRTYWQMAEKMPGWSPEHEDWIKVNGYGYRHFVQRFDRLLEALGLAEESILNDLAGIHGTAPQNAWVSPIADAMARLSGKPAQKIRKTLRSLDEERGFLESISDLI
jgi:hypothetical protein